ncbi:Probable RNA-directed DNA polymerase from transposon BS [Eumeta japonica]|uniref:Probable RNA-directed DNA polymerase from transposon BS n=1 Tax=Eumeta variegata TaxID=151549 RepID=A0A4C1XN11_EUMVA|nr:Probable RNA-directed DNA polymerase from transposon BS [Eumeta japonica]
MEATGCRLAMTGHSTLVIVSVYLPSPKRLLRRDLRALFALGDAVILFGALTNHVRTVVEESEREVPASSDRRKFPPDILELIRAKTQLCPRERISHSRVQIQSASSPTRNSTDREKRSPKTSRTQDDLAPVSLSEVQTLVKSLNTRKAPGLDGGGGYRHPQARETTRPPCQLQTDQPPERSGQTIRKNSQTRLSDHLLGKGLIIDEQFGFRPAHSCPQQVLRLVEYVSEGFETERSTVAVFFDVAKAFDRVWHAANRHFTFRHERTHSTRRLIRAGVPQGSILLCCTPRTQTMYRDRRRLASNSRYSRTIPRSFTEIGIGAPDSPSSPPEGH